MYSTQIYIDHKESGKHDTKKVTNKAPITNPKEMGIHELFDKEFKITILKELSALQEKRDN